MKKRFFDFEVMAHWWLCVLGDYDDSQGECPESAKDDFTIITSDMSDARDVLVKMLREPGYVIVGYNIKGYDLIIANAIYNGFSPEQVKIVNDLIINPGCAWSSKEHMRLQSFVKKKLKGTIYQDLLDDDTGSLKEKEAVMGLDIRETTVDFDKEHLTSQDKDDLIFYCKHDVWACIYYYIHVRKDYIDTKLAIGKTFNLPEEQVYACTNAKLCGIVLGAKRTSFADEYRDDIELNSRIKDYIYDNLPSKLVNDIKDNKYILNDKTGKMTSKSITSTIFENEVSFGNGGVHSILAPNIYIESDDEWVMMNVDGASFYPSLLIFQNCLSRAVSNPKFFKEIFDTRIALKWKKDKTEDDKVKLLSYKLVLNTTFGASGNKYLDLYDQYMQISCCRIGQLLLTALANALYKRVNGLKVIQTNTDGVLAFFRRKDIPLVMKIGEEWSNVTNIQLEYEEVSKIWQRDVNNYLLVEPDGKIKNRGAWLIDKIEKIGYSMIGTLNFFACSRAAQAFLLEGKDIVKSIVENDNIRDFVAFCKKGPTYSRVVHKLANGTELELNKCNRVYATKDQSYGMLYKIKKYKDRLSYTKMADIPEHCKTINESLDKVKMTDIKKELDYMFYIARTIDILDIPWIGIGDTAKCKVNDFRYQ